jgi:hypothetical protein
MDLSSIGLWVQILRIAIVVLQYILEAMTSRNPEGLQKLRALAAGLEQFKDSDPYATEYFSSAFKHRG